MKRTKPPFAIMRLAPLVWFALTISGLAAAPRERVNFDADWRFAKGDPVDVGTAPTYASLRPWIMSMGADLTGPTTLLSARPPGEPSAITFAQPGFDDSAWRRLDLPHDWGIEGSFDQTLPGATAKLPWAGVGWYRKHFPLPASDQGKRVCLEIDGAMAYSAVWVNGRFAGGWPSGYTSYALDLTPYLTFGADNVVAIRLDNPPESSRWYPGGGLYRHVWLTTTQPVHVAHWGTFITTPEVKENTATVEIRTRLRNETAQKAEAQVTTDVFEIASTDPWGNEAMAHFEGRPVQLAPGGEALSVQSAILNRPQLWSPERPKLYRAVTTVTVAGAVCDTVETTFGVRTLRFDPDRGFFLNGKHVPLQGVCLHHDLGALGTAVNTRALERQLDLLCEMGCNAIRTSHNPPAPELLDLCDRKGLLVMDEAFDCWRQKKAKNDYHLLFDDWHERDLRALLRRDRNHPSVIVWSIGNEVKEESEATGWKLAAHLAAIVHEEDRTRPVSQACEDPVSGFNGFQTALDVMGYNYDFDAYASFHAANPSVPVFGSENASTVSTRGAYFFPLGQGLAFARRDFQANGYDVFGHVLPEVEFEAEDRNPYVAGEFVWTGFDYLGEPFPFSRDSKDPLPFSDPALKAKADQQLATLGKILVPSRSSYFGILDLAGFKKDRFYLYQSRWRPDLPMAHLLPHWTWPGREGQVTPVVVYTSGDEAELFLNGRSLGRLKKELYQYKLRWDDVRYEPGELKVVAYKNGAKWAEDAVRTAGSPARILLTADRVALTADGQDLSFLTASIVDAKGVPVPDAANKVRFEAEGAGRIIAVDNGDPISFEPFQATEHAAFHGLCLGILRPEKEKLGSIKVTARADGLESAAVELRSVGQPPDHGNDRSARG